MLDGQISTCVWGPVTYSDRNSIQRKHRGHRCFGPGRTTRSYQTHLREIPSHQKLKSIFRHPDSKHPNSGPSCGPPRKTSHVTRYGTATTEYMSERWPTFRRLGPWGPYFKKGRLFPSTLWVFAGA